MKMPFFVTTLVLAVAGSANAGTIYNNTVTDTLQTYVYSTGPYTQLGDSITLGGTDRLLTDATVQFFNLGAMGTFSATLRFWNTGSPVGLQIGSSYVLNSIAIGASAIANVTFSSLGLAVPNTLVFTVEVTNATGGVDVGLTAFEPPSIGSSNNAQIITRIGSTFSATGTAVGEGNLFLMINAIPEPSTLTMAGGAAMLALLAARKRRK